MKMTPLEEAKKLQKKVQKVYRENTDLSEEALAKRFGIGLMKFNSF